uniref:PASTA domain-containing protein n=2 Tax=Fervidobacterium pennivorans TaxID=93466 RepID=A0A7V4KBN0_FERPE
MIDKRIKKAKNGSSKKKKHVGVTVISFPVLVVMTIILAVISGLLAFYLVMFLETKRGTVLLPNFVGTDVQTAERQLKDLGFKVEKIGDVGRVINMDPPGGTVVKKGRKVKLFVENAVQKSLILPDFKGTWYGSVQKIFDLMGIHSTVKKVPEEELDGTVIQTSPTPGNRVVTGDVVTLFVSSGAGRTDTSVPENNQQSVEETDTQSTSSVLENAQEVIPPSVPVESQSVPVESQNFDETAPGPIYMPEDDWERPENEEDGEDAESPIIQGGQF